MSTLLKRMKRMPIKRSADYPHELKATKSSLSKFDRTHQERLKIDKVVI
jgi:hypothetical protein